MRGIIQRVHNASVYANGAHTGSIKRGLLIYVCFALIDKEDNSTQKISTFAQKCTKLRIFCDESNKLNKSVLDIKGDVLLIPNFTLYAQYKKGTRPQFSSGLEYKKAEELFETTVHVFTKLIYTASGVFGSSMNVESSADGPLNLILDVPHTTS